MDNSCDFCDRTKFEERIVVEKEESFVIASLGQITNSGYLLLIPKRHISCIGNMNEAEMERFIPIIEEVWLAIKDIYKISPITLFEHGIVGQTIKHAHLHFVPAICNITKGVKKDFLKNEIQQIFSWQELRGLYQERKEPYLFWLGSDAKMNVCFNPNAPLQYLRTIVAEEIGRPERANWRNMNTELDKKLTKETINKLKPLFY